MFEKKKILLIGPPSAGKTTIKQVFFEKVNPYKLINNTLPPTRGINSKVYTLNDFEIGVFDLAGQENKNWFSNDRDVFLNSNLIICVFDVNTYIKDMKDFFMKLIKLYKQVNLTNCSIVIFLHKVDLIEKLLLHHKIKAFNDFIEREIPTRKIIKIFHTSIAPDFFLETFDHIAEILRELLSIRNISEYESMFKEFRKGLEILINYDTEKPNLIENLFYDLNLQKKEALKHLSQLANLGLVDLIHEKNQFILTKKAEIFKSNMSSNKSNQIKINRILDAMHLFSNLNEK